MRGHREIDGASQNEQTKSGKQKENMDREAVERHNQKGGRFERSKSKKG